jgi:hypothetical protein
MSGIYERLGVFSRVVANTAPNLNSINDKILREVAIYELPCL